MILGGFYGLSLPLWGAISDRNMQRTVLFIGGMLTLVSLVFFGPLPFIDVKLSVGMVVVCLIVQGRAVQFRSDIS